MSSEQIDAQAGDWLARLDRGGVSADVEDEFRAWCEADPRHYAAYLRLQDVWGRLERLRALHRQDASAPELARIEPVTVHAAATLAGPEENQQSLPRRVVDAEESAATSRAEEEPVTQPWLARPPMRARVRAYLASSLAAAVLVALGASWFWQHRASYFTTETRYATSLGGFQRVALSDGSIVQINTDSEVRVVLRAAERDVELVRGEATFEVAPDASRPFIVAAGGTAVRAVGTNFNVHKIPAGLEVMIVEGAVAVGPVKSMSVPGSLPVVGAGRFAIARAAQLEIKDIDEDEVARRLAWQRGMLGFNGQTLADVVAEFNRYNERKLEIGEPTVGQLRIGGYFRATNVDAFVRVIEERFGISATRQPDRIVLRHAPGR